MKLNHHRSTSSFSIRHGRSSVRYVFLFVGILLIHRLTQGQSRSVQFAEVDSLNEACKANWFSDTNRAIELGTNASQKAVNIGYGEGLATSYNNTGVAFWVRGESDRALQLYYQSINVRDTVGGTLGLCNTYHNIGNIFRDREDYGEAKNWYRMALNVRYEIKDSLGISYTINNLGLIAQAEGKYDSANALLTRSLELREALKNTRGIATSHMSLGKLKIKQKEYRAAQELFLKALSEWESIQHYQGQADTYLELAKLSRMKGDLSELQSFVSRGITQAHTIEAKPQLLELYQLSADAYLQARDTVAAYRQLQQAYTYRNAIFDERREGMIQQYNLDQAAHTNALLQKENLLQKAQILQQNDREKLIGVIGISLLMLLVMLYGFFRVRVKSNKELTARNRQLNQTLQDLKKTQFQLIESEKMASLGTLTAGVSHEINNPLNFVTGAHEVLTKQLSKDQHLDKEAVEGSLSSIQLGIERISKIVTGLNQFSRRNDQMNETCDLHHILDNCLLMLNKQLDERITLNKHYAPASPKISGNVGKLHQVFLNVLSNAIQAIPEEGSIEIKTATTAGRVRIEIIDNGTGIAPSDIHQITNPFFTTKPPGEGTGLGLAIVNSILLDHGGSLAFESSQPHGTKVIIELPEERES